MNQTTNRRVLLALVVQLAFITAGGHAEEPLTPTSWKPDPVGFETIAKPFLADYCAKCHTGPKVKGDFSIEKHLPNDFFDRAALERWNEVVDVLNSHDMPPQKSKQPPAPEVAGFVDWITAQSVNAEMFRRDRPVVLRRLNRHEYRNTIRDLIGVDFDVSGFPQDPPAGGFDNNGSALTMSPFQMELYLNSARQILDRALVKGKKPPTIRWHFAPKASPDADRRRIRLDDRNNAILNGGNNKEDKGYIVVRSDSWDKGVNARDFRVPVEGLYAVRLHAWGRIPTRQDVVASAQRALETRKADQDKSNPKGKASSLQQFEQDLKHFQTDRMYDYGPPRVKLIQHLGSQPRTVAEFDVDGTGDHPKTHEFQVRFTTESAGINWDYAYSIPKVLENFWIQGNEDFARPEMMVDWFEIEGPLYSSWPPPSHTKILPDSALKISDQEGYARVVIADFMKKAYRRPVDDAEILAKLALFDRALLESSDFVDAIKRPLTTILSSPNFLFLTEPARDPQKLSNHELASRLSYFLWSSSPDDELRALADQGLLETPEILRKQVDRMLADPKARALSENFASQWLGLREVGANPPAPDLYPQYDRHLETSIIGESQGFFNEILKNDLSVLNFIKSDFVTINERLARFYGLNGVKGDGFRRLAVPPDSHRSGLVTQASMLTTTSNGTRTSPVKRGTWILKNLLGTDPRLPVANVGEIAPKVPGIDKATVRRRLEIHRELEQCARCHSKIDPLGFALENYNAAGEWRDQEGFGYKGRVDTNDPKIDASSMMPDGTAIVGVTGLQEALLKREDLFLSCLAKKLSTYALGRELGLADQPTIKAEVATMKRQNYTLKSLIHAIVASDRFGTK